MIEAQAKQLVTGPTGQVVTLPEVKLHLRIDHSEEDSLLTTYLLAAVRDVEKLRGSPILTQTWIAKYRCWGTLLLPFQNVSAVNSVKYRDVSGNLQTVTGTTYVVELASRPPFITAGWSKIWPTSEMQPGLPIEVEMDAGAASAPEELKAAVLLGVERLHYMAQKDLGQGTATDAYLKQLDRSYYNLIGYEQPSGVAL